VTNDEGAPLNPANTTDQVERFEAHRMHTPHFRQTRC
jgi:hypothetical protein